MANVTSIRYSGDQEAGKRMLKPVLALLARVQQEIAWNDLPQLRRTFSIPPGIHAPLGGFVHVDCIYGVNNVLIHIPVGGAPVRKREISGKPYLHIQIKGAGRKAVSIVWDFEEDWYAERDFNIEGPVLSSEIGQFLGLTMRDSRPMFDETPNISTPKGKLPFYPEDAPFPSTPLKSLSWTSGCDLSEGILDPPSETYFCILETYLDFVPACADVSSSINVPQASVEMEAYRVPPPWGTTYTVVVDKGDPCPKEHPKDRCQLSTYTPDPDNKDEWRITPYIGDDCDDTWDITEFSDPDYNVDDDQKIKHTILVGIHDYTNESFGDSDVYANIGMETWDGSPSIRGWELQIPELSGTQEHHIIQQSKERPVLKYSPLERLHYLHTTSGSIYGGPTTASTGTKLYETATTRYAEQFRNLTAAEDQMYQIFDEFGARPPDGYNGGDQNLPAVDKVPLNSGSSRLVFHADCELEHALEYRRPILHTGDYTFPEMLATDFTETYNRALKWTVRLFTPLGPLGTIEGELAEFCEITVYPDLAFPAKGLEQDYFLGRRHLKGVYSSDTQAQVYVVHYNMHKANMPYISAWPFTPSARPPGSWSGKVIFPSTYETHLRPPVGTQKTHTHFEHQFFVHASASYNGTSNAGVDPRTMPRNEKLEEEIKALFAMFYEVNEMDTTRVDPDYELVVEIRKTFEVTESEVRQ